MSRNTPTANAAILPVWFRRALIVVAALLMCSCRADGQEFAHGAPPCPACPTEGCESGCDAGCNAGCVVCPPGRLVGPADEYLCDGDDYHFPAGVTTDGKIVGLEQEDTIGHYTAPDGRVFVAPSSRVCIYAPRFGAVRRVIHPMGAEQRLFVDAVGDAFTPAEADRTDAARAALFELPPYERAGELPPSLYRGREQAGATVRLRKAAEVRGLVGPYAMLDLVTLGQIVGSEQPVIANHALAAIVWTGDQQVQVTISGQGASALLSVKHPGILFQTDEPNRPRLRIVKLASDGTAHPGDEIAFTLRVDNVGDTVLRDVVIVDNLTTRLAYLDGSADATLEADFSTERNDAGSLVLRWALAEPLEVGDGGVLTFKVRVR